MLTTRRHPPRVKQGREVDEEELAKPEGCTVGIRGAMEEIERDDGEQYGDGHQYDGRRVKLG